MQQALDNTINTISRVGSFALTMVGGAKLGSAGGLWALLLVAQLQVLVGNK